jgi:hypothetical protein
VKQEIRVIVLSGVGRVDSPLHGMLISDPAIRERVRELTFELLGEGEPLP